MTTRTPEAAAAAASCGHCGKTSDLMQCKKCKSVVYCSAQCQRFDWSAHIPQCLRKEFAGSPCGSCRSTERHVFGCCLECGHLHCNDCATAADAVLSSCPTCRHQPTRIMESVRVAQRRLKKIGKDSPRDPRKPQWLVHLASTYQGLGPNGITQAKLYYVRA